MESYYGNSKPYYIISITIKLSYYTMPASTLKKISATLFLVLLTLYSFKAMATDYYWVNGGGQWSNFSNHWAKASGSAQMHNQVPTPFDNVIFDQQSFNTNGDTIDFNVTVLTCNSMDWSGVDKRLVVNGLIEHSLHLYGSLTLSGKLNLLFPGNIYFKSTGTSNNITMNGAAVAQNVLSFDGSGSWTVTDSLNALHIYHNAGTLQTNDKIIRSLHFESNSNTLRTLLLGKSDLISNTIRIGGSNLSMDATQATFSLVGGNAWLTVSGYSTSKIKQVRLLSAGFPRINSQRAIGKIYCAALASNVSVTSSNTVDSLISYCDLVEVTISVYLTYFYASKSAIILNQTYTINHLVIDSVNSISFKGMSSLNIMTLTQTGNSCSNYLYIRNSNTLDLYSPNGVNLIYTILNNIKVYSSGPASTCQGTDLGGNVGWTFTSLPSQDMFWIGDSGNWRDPAHWSYSSGGSSCGCIPSPVNNVVMDAASFNVANSKVLLDQKYQEIFFHSMDWSGTDITVFFRAASYLYTNTKAFATGSITMTSYLENSYFPSALSMQSSAIETIKSVNYHFQSISVKGPGEVHLLDDLNSSTIVLTGGKFFTEGYTLTADVMNQSIGWIDYSNSNLNVTELTFSPNKTLSISTNSIINCRTIKAPYTGLLNIVNCTNSYDFDMLLDFNKCSVTKLSLNGHFRLTNDFTADSVLYYEKARISGGRITLLGGIKCFGTCNKLIPFLNHSFVKSSGTINVEYVSLINSSASGGASFFAASSLDLGGNTGWSLAPLISGALYWIGGTGNWTDHNHWSSTSGGTPIDCGYPTSFNNVNFDQNSFTTETNNDVILDINDVRCDTFNASLLTKHVRFVSSNYIVGNMFISGSAYFSKNNYSTFQGLIILLVSKNKGEELITNGTLIPSLMFNTINGGYTLKDNLTANRLDIQYGEISLSKKTVNVSSININLDNNLMLTIDSTTINVSASALYPQSEFRLENKSTGLSHFNTNQSKINLIGYYSGYPISSYFYSSGNPTLYNEINFVNGKTDYFNSANCTINTFTTSSVVTKITGSNTFGNFKVVPGRTVSFANDQTFTGDIDAVGFPGFPIFLNSLTNGSTIHLTKNSGTVCFDYLYLEDLTVQGGAQFIAGPNSSDINNNSGWDFMSTCLKLGIVTDKDFICFNEPIAVSITTGSGSCNPGNKFILQLSAPNGTFTSFTNLDTLEAFSADTFHFELPNTITPSNRYRMRAYASDPYLVSTDNGFDITIGALKKIYIDADKDGYPGYEYYLQCLPIQPDTLNMVVDCDDHNIYISPQNSEICGNGIDDNCNGVIDEGGVPKPIITFTADSIFFESVSDYPMIEWSGVNYYYSSNAYRIAIPDSVEYYFNSTTNQWIDSMGAVDKENFSITYFALSTDCIYYDTIQTHKYSSTSTEYTLSVGSLKISPNPAQETLYIESIQPITSMTILNSLGVTVYQNELIKEASATIDIRNLKAEIYYIKIIDTLENQQTLKFIKRE